jgi:hypothetical protein
MSNNDDTLTNTGGAADRARTNDEAAGATDRGITGSSETTGPVIAPGPPDMTEPAEATEPAGVPESEESERDTVYGTSINDA